MSMFLNKKEPYLNYQELTRSRYFVDKSEMLDELIDCSENGQKHLCFTRPRRFGKSVMASMVAAYFGNAYHGGEIFDGLKISKSEHYQKHLNKSDVIYIDFSRVPRADTSFQEYMDRISDGIFHDVQEMFPDLDIHENMAIWDVLEQTERRYVFVLDEWDAVFHMDFVSDRNKNQYLLFLKNLLKDKFYVRLAYMTGVLPIAKYSSGSELNMFVEYSMVSPKRFSGYFGFTGQEVDHLYKKYQEKTGRAEITRELLRVWYDGYYNAEGERLYNPRSVICALNNNEVSNYWTSSGPYDEVFYYIRNGISDVKEDIAFMVSGECVSVKAREYAATAPELNTKNQIYSAMIVYGLLTYHNGQASIPNKELMDKFDELLMEKQEMGYVHQLARRSEAMLKATLAGDTDTMARIMDFAHNTESPILRYNSEIELAAVINLVYLAARDKYRVVREEKAGKGFADFVFYPYQRERDCLILELKMGASPKDAIAQIREKDYALAFTKEAGYTGRILLVGIGYDVKEKRHSCRVETLS